MLSLSFAEYSQAAESYGLATSHPDMLLDRYLTYGGIPFTAIKDNFPKTLISLDHIGLGDYNGIAHVNATDWLLRSQPTPGTD